MESLSRALRGRGRLVISFDLELGFGNPGPLSSTQLLRVRRARELLPELLSLFRAHQVAVTWATTMALSHQGIQSAQGFLEEQGELELWKQVKERYPSLGLNPECYFAPEFVRTLAADPSQELACHTYSHTFWTTLGSPTRELERQLRLSRSVAEALGATVTSLVFPRNRYSESALSVARSHQFSAFRSDAFVSGRAELTKVRVAAGRVFRYLDAFGLGPPGAWDPAIQVLPGLVQIPGQRFLRFDDPKWLRSLHWSQVSRELRAAGEQGQLLHLWSHPENLARDLGAALSALRAILAEACELRDQGVLEVVTMGELSREVLSSSN